jgi:hypothetical protein
MARYRRSIEDALKDMSGQARTNAGLTLSVPELQELGSEYIAENAIENIHIAVGAISTESFDEVLTETVNDLVHGVDRIDNEILPAITEAANSPITDDRLIAGSLSTWPFAPNAIPEGSVGSAELTDFSLVARKFKDDRHRIY